MYTGVIALGKETRFIHQVFYCTKNLVLEQSDQHAENNKFDSQKRSDNKFVMKDKKAVSLAKFLLNCDIDTKYTF